MSNRFVMGQGPASVGLVYDHLFPLSYGGAEKVYRLLGDALVEQGVNVMYLTRFQGAIKPGNSFPFHVDVIWEGQLYDSSGTRRIGPALAWSLAVFRALRRHRFDAVVLSATPIFNVLVGMVLKCFQPSVRLVIDWPEIWPLRKWTSYSGVATGTIAWMLQSACLRVGKIKLVNSDATLERLPAIARKSAMKMPLLTMAGPPVGSGPGFPTNELLFVGRHIPDKNLPMLPRVLAALQTEYPDIHATVVGEGPDRKVTESIASDLGVSDRISFVGRVDDEELARRLQAAGVLFFPSVREGFGLVVCEAARWGTPVVVVNHVDNAAKDLVSAGVNGAVASSADVEDLCVAVRSCLEGGSTLRHATKDWYDKGWALSGGFAEVARAISELVNS